MTWEWEFFLFDLVLLLPMEECAAIYEFVRNMMVIPLFGDFSCRSVGIAKRQHDWPSLTLISDAVDSQTRCTFSHLGAAQQSITVQTEGKQSGVSRKF